jgi:hypothetical protein
MRVGNERPFNSDSLTSGQIIDSVISRNISGDGYFIEKADIQLFINGKKERYLVNIKFRNPDRFLISLKNAAGIEGARIFLTKDSVFINDRINSRIIVGKVSALESRTGIPVNFLNMVFGDFFIRDDGLESETERTNNQVVITNNNSKYTIKTSIDTNIGKVINVEIKNKYNGEKATLEFKNFTTGAKKVPLLIKFDDNERKLGCNLRILRFQIPWHGEIDFLPGKGYTKEEFK